MFIAHGGHSTCLLPPPSTVYKCKMRITLLQLQRSKVALPQHASPTLQIASRSPLIYGIIFVSQTNLARFAKWSSNAASWLISSLSGLMLKEQGSVLCLHVASLAKSARTAGNKKRPITLSSFACEIPKPWRSRNLQRLHAYPSVK